MSIVRRRPLGAFYVVTFTWSWGYWIAVAATGGTASHFPGLLGPMAGAIVVTFALGGREGLARLLAQFVRWRVRPVWYAVAVAPGMLALGTLGVLALAGREFPAVGELSRMPGLPSIGWLGVFVLVLVVNGYGEEVGWRGFAMPRLREHRDLVSAALPLTVVWALWHVPTFFIDSGLTIPIAVLPGWLIGLFAGAIVLGWLYERSGESLLVVSLFHALLNMGSATTATEGIPAGVLSAGVIAGAIVIARGERTRAHRERTT